MRDIAGPFDASAAWYSTAGEVQIDEADDNVLSSNPEFTNQCIVRRGSRAGWYEMTYKFKWTTLSVGPLVRFLSQGDYLAIGIKVGDGKARLYKRENDGKRQTKVTSATALTLTAGSGHDPEGVIVDLASGTTRSYALSAIFFVGRIVLSPVPWMSTQSLRRSRCPPTCYC